MAYSEPFYKPHTTRNAQLFNTRKTSTIFTPGGESEVPPVFVDRFGLKGWTSQVRCGGWVCVYGGWGWWSLGLGAGGYSWGLGVGACVSNLHVEHCVQLLHPPPQITGQDNKVEHALMLQLVSTLDENGQVWNGGRAGGGGGVTRGYRSCVWGGGGSSAAVAGAATHRHIRPRKFVSTCHTGPSMYSAPNQPTTHTPPALSGCGQGHQGPARLLRRQRPAHHQQRQRS